MAGSRRRPASSPRITFTIPDAQWDFWQQCQNQAQHQHLSLRNWLMQEITRPDYAASSSVAAFNAWYQGLQHGRQQGYLMAQLATAFETHTEQTLDRAMLWRWQQQHPRDWQDILVWTAQQPWAVRFTPWLQQEPAAESAADHNY